jgi:putative transposase
VVKDFSTA